VRRHRARRCGDDGKGAPTNGRITAEVGRFL
jgi:hypothetical protein